MNADMAVYVRHGARVGRDVPLLLAWGTVHLWHECCPIRRSRLPRKYPRRKSESATAFFFCSLATLPFRISCKPTLCRRDYFTLEVVRLVPHSLGSSPPSRKARWRFERRRLRMRHDTRGAVCAAIRLSLDGRTTAQCVHCQPEIAASLAQPQECWRVSGSV